MKAAEKGRLLSSPAMITNHDSASQRRWQKMVDPNKDMTLPPQVRTATTVDEATETKHHGSVLRSLHRLASTDETKTFARALELTRFGT